MKCSSCKRELGRGWNFCAYCSKEVPRVFRFRLPKIKFGGEGLFETFQMPFGGGSIQISVGTPGRQRVFKPEIEEAPVRKREQQKMTVKRVVEPEMQIKKYGAETVIEIKMPGTSSENVVINRVGESLEVRGYAGDRTYFKVIPVNRNQVISSQEFEDNTLKIKIGH